MAGLRVGLDIGAVKKGLAVFDAREGIADICLPRANRLDLAPFQLDAGFVALENVIISQCFAIDDRLSRHIAQSRGDQPCLARRLGAVRRVVNRLVS